jgi:hypothetical protein
MLMHAKYFRDHQYHRQITFLPSAAHSRAVLSALVYRAKPHLHCQAFGIGFNHTLRKHGQCCCRKADADCCLNKISAIDAFINIQFDQAAAVFFVAW